jgi:hypothetical protein
MGARDGKRALTFSGARFQRLVEMLAEAYIRLGVRDTVRHVTSH